jgi:hypothetical protein
VSISSAALHFWYQLLFSVHLSCCIVCWNRRLGIRTQSSAHGEVAVASADFPRDDSYDPSTGGLVPGNGGTFEKCRRLWSLSTAEYLRYRYAALFCARCLSELSFTQTLRFCAEVVTADESSMPMTFCLKPRFGTEVADVVDTSLCACMHAYVRMGGVGCGCVRTC